MAKPTIAQLTAKIALLEAANAMQAERLLKAEACYKQQAMKIRDLEAKPQVAAPKAAWSPSAKLAAAKELAMATGRVTKVA